MSRAVDSAVVDRPSWSSHIAGRVAAATQTRRSQIAFVLALAFYFGFACYLTWPVVTELGHSIYGGTGDPYGSIAFYRELAAHHLNPFLPGAIAQFSAPEGQAIPWARDLASAPGTLALYLPTVLFGAIPAYGLYTLTGYALTGAVTFLLARRLTANTWAALIAGWAFAFYPFAALNGQGHLENIQGWVIVLAVWRMLELLWHPSRRNGLLAGLAVVLSMWWGPYFILFGGITYVVVTVAALFFAWRDGKLRTMLGAQLIAALCVLALAACLGALAHAETAAGTGVRSHTVYELFTYGARPLEYLLPDVQSPLFGSDTRNYLDTNLHGSNNIEATLYVGVTVILLALAALGAYARRRLAPWLGRAVLTLWLLAATAFIFSMSPEVEIFGVSIPFPSHFVALVTTTWRAYSRFVIIVMLALALLAAIGLDALTRGRRPWIKIGVMLLATIAVPLDLWAPQGANITRIKTPSIYRTLARQPPGLVAQYPIGPAAASLYNPLFYQDVYDMPTINGFLEGSFEETRGLSLANLTYPAAASRLAALGVRYVLVAPGPLGRGFRLIAREPFAYLYAVTASPLGPALATTGEGFQTVAETSYGPIAWLVQPRGTIELAGPCTTCNGVLRMTLLSTGQPRQVTISEADGHVLARGSVAGATQVNLPLRFTKRTILHITTQPGPQPVGQGEEAISASVRVTNLEFLGAGRPAGSRPAPG
jgi:hypothetical protein